MFDLGDFTVCNDFYYTVRLNQECLYMNHGDIYKFAGEEGRKSEIVTKSVS
jgi:hypothetical protein